MIDSYNDSEDIYPSNEFNNVLVASIFCDQPAALLNKDTRMPCNDKVSMHRVYVPNVPNVENQYSNPLYIEVPAHWFIGTSTTIYGETKPFHPHGFEVMFNGYTDTGEKFCLPLGDRAIIPNHDFSNHELTEDKKWIESDEKYMTHEGRFAARKLSNSTYGTNFYVRFSFKCFFSRRKNTRYQFIIRPIYANPTDVKMIKELHCFNKYIFSTAFYVDTVEDLKTYEMLLVSQTIANFENAYISLKRYTHSLSDEGRKEILDKLDKIYGEFERKGRKYPLYSPQRKQQKTTEKTDFGLPNIEDLIQFSDELSLPFGDIFSVSDLPEVNNKHELSVPFLTDTNGKVL